MRKKDVEIGGYYAAGRSMVAPSRVQVLRWERRGITVFSGYSQYFKDAGGWVCLDKNQKERFYQSNQILMPWTEYEEYRRKEKEAQEAVRAHLAAVGKAKDRLMAALSSQGIEARASVSRATGSSEGIVLHLSESQALSLVRILWSGNLPEVDAELAEIEGTSL